ncbi:MAG: hypothetical protein JJ975_05920 [Bacteroidia bacterium]|nr:hypothetical protein [Bacteroidia bacterium]
MKFKFYDILTHLVPGFVFFILLLDHFDKSFSNDMIVPATAISFILGYFANTLSSWLEGVYYWTWGGKPSTKLLKGKDVWKVRFYEHEYVNALLRAESNSEDSSHDALFQIAMRNAALAGNTRVSDFNASYGFSRIILTTLIVSSIVLFISYPKELSVYIIAVPMMFVAWLRCKQRAYYYAREVLFTFIQSKNGTKPLD